MSRFAIGTVSPEDSLFDFRPAGRVPVWSQATAVTFLWITMVLAAYWEYREHGSTFGYGGPATWILFVPIAEELIFRGFLLTQFVRRGVSNVWAIAGSSALFGLWHLRNVFWHDSEVIGQMLYAGLFFGPLAGYLTLRFRTLWPAVILHYLNNLQYFHNYL